MDSINRPFCLSDALTFNLYQITDNNCIYRCTQNSKRIIRFYLLRGTFNFISSLISLFIKNIVSFDILFLILLFVKYICIKKEKNPYMKLFKSYGRDLADPLNSRTIPPLHCCVFQYIFFPLNYLLKKKLLAFSNFYFWMYHTFGLARTFLASLHLSKSSGFVITLCLACPLE